MVETLAVARAAIIARPWSIPLAPHGDEQPQPYNEGTDRHERSEKQRSLLRVHTAILAPGSTGAK
jgi:hypothetical protein